MTITRSEIISSVAGVCAAAAAVTSAMALSAAPTFVGTADIKLGKMTQVENWEHTPASFGSSCTLKGIISYDVKGPETLTGNIGGAIHLSMVANGLAAAWLMVKALSASTCMHTTKTSAT